MTTPREYHTENADSDSVIYESDSNERMYQEPLLHLEMKRDYAAHTKDEHVYEKKAKGKNSTDSSLFEKYQYFTPGEQ